MSAHWVLPPGIPQYFAPARPGARYVPMIVGAANVRFTDTKAKIDETRPLTVVTPLTADPIPVNWEQAEPAALRRRAAVDGAAVGRDVRRAAGRGEQGEELRRLDQGRLSPGCPPPSRSTSIRSPSLKLVSNAGESEGDFRARLQQAARELRDAEVTRLRQKFAPKAAALQEKLRRAEQAVQKEEEQASAQKTQTAISFGTTVLGALFRPQDA